MLYSVSEFVYMFKHHWFVIWVVRIS